MNIPKLDDRLQSAVGYVRRGAVLADVGTDHAYLPVYLAAQGYITRAVASDIGEGPLARARAHIAAYGQEEKIDTLLCDGLAGIERFAPTDIVVFGMGGELIVRILDASMYIKQAGIRLILQPMTHAEIVRTYLSRAGFSVVGERLSRENGKTYQTIAADYTGGPYAIDELHAHIGRFAEWSDDADEEALRQAFLRHKMDVLRAVIDGKSRAGVSATDETRLLEEMGGCL